MRASPVVAGLLCVLLLASCRTPAPVPPRWSARAAGTVVLPRAGVEAALPPGWIQLDAYDRGLLITRDGLPMQFIKIIRAPHKVAFENIGKQGAPDLLPNELAELLIASNKARPGMASVAVTLNQPAELAGREGVKVGFAFRNARGAAYDELAYAVADDDGVLMFQYQALSRHFFARDLPAFEALVASARRIDKTDKKR